MPLPKRSFFPESILKKSTVVTSAKTRPVFYVTFALSGAEQDVPAINQEIPYTNFCENAPGKTVRKMVIPTYLCLSWLFPALCTLEVSRNGFGQRTLLIYSGVGEVVREQGEQVKMGNNIPLPQPIHLTTEAFTRETECFNGFTAFLLPVYGTIEQHLRDWRIHAIG